MSQPLYEIGDTVKLASGGPDMTINEQHRAYHASLPMNERSFSGTYKTQWFAGKKLESGIFPESSLILVRRKGQEG